MELNLPRNTMYLIIGIIGLLILLFAVVFIPRGGPPREVSVTPTPVPTEKPPYLEPGYNGPLPGSESQAFTPESSEEIRRSKIIGGFLDKLPFEGENFSLSYDISNNSFIATLNSNEISRANQEFDQFLTQNGIESRDWLYNLKVERI